MCLKNHCIVLSASVQEFFKHALEHDIRDMDGRNHYSKGDYFFK